MKTHRSTILTTMFCIAAALATACAAPASALAGPLLSGYGGPGDGNQAILGSTLIGGPGGGPRGGGSGGGGSGGGGSSPSVYSAQGALGSGPAPAARGGGSASSGSGSSGSGSRAATPTAPVRGAARASQPTGAELRARAYDALQRAGSAPAGLLSGADITYIVLAAGALAFTGVLTRRMASTRTAKGH